MSPDEYCQRITSRSGSSFSHTFRFLEPDRRRAITALYAFCREVDDAVDECVDYSIARLTLAWWRAEVSRAFADTPHHSVMLALQPYIDTYGLEERHLQAIIDGMEMDLDQTRYPDFNALKQYCWHVAGAVGILSARIFGIADPRTLKYAERLGLAFQLTNIIRDVGEDARIGRIYLPQDELLRFGVTSDDILRARRPTGFTALMRHQTARARIVYEEALGILPHHERRAQRPGLMMAGVYRALLDRIERENFPVLTKRVSLSPLHKWWLASKVRLWT